MSTRKKLTGRALKETVAKRGKATGARTLHVTKKTIKATKAGKPVRVQVVRSALVTPPTADDAGFLGQADPALLQAMLETAQAELAFREGALKQREV